VPKDATGLPLGPGRTVAITADVGVFAGPVVDAGTGRYERRLGAGARGAAATITATVDGTALLAQPRVFFVDTRDEIDAPLTAAGGACAAIPARAVGPLTLALLLAVAGARRRRGRRYPGGPCSRKAK
jgi:hypothetical protein